MLRMPRSAEFDLHAGADAQRLGVHVGGGRQVLDREAERFEERDVLIGRRPSPRPISSSPISATMCSGPMSPS
jgi:hypothetical protein